MGFTKPIEQIFITFLRYIYVSKRYYTRLTIKVADFGNAHCFHPVTDAGNCKNRRVISSSMLCLIAASISSISEVNS